MEISLQRLGDNPRDHDGSFTGFYPAAAADVNGLKPDMNPSRAEDPRAAPTETRQAFKPWKVYPAPPPAHWHWQSGNLIGAGGEGIESSERHANGQPKLVNDQIGQGDSFDARGTNGAEGFNFADCEIPGKDERGFSFAMDNHGLYQVYDSPPPAEGQLLVCCLCGACIVSDALRVQQTGRRTRTARPGLLPRHSRSPFSGQSRSENTIPTSTFCSTFAQMARPNRLHSVG